MIAMALSCTPELIIADEPTTALDVTVQAQILELIAEMREKFGTAVLIITHNLGVVARYVDRLNVMYAGSLVETGPTAEICGGCQSETPLYDGSSQVSAPPGQTPLNGDETVSAFFQDMRGRGLGDPLLAVCDGAPGIIKAIETCFPRSERQRCLFHRMSNLAAKVSREDAWPEFREQARAAYQAPSRAIARGLAADLARKWENEFPTAVACFQDDFEACIAHLRMPVRHRKAIRTTNLLERLFGEERRRLKVIPNAWGEKAVLKLMFAAMTRASEKWRPIAVTGFGAGQEGSGRGIRKGERAAQQPRKQRRASPNYPAL